MTRPPHKLRDPAQRVCGCSADQASGDPRVEVVLGTLGWHLRYLDQSQVNHQDGFSSSAPNLVGTRTHEPDPHLPPVSPAVAAVEAACRPRPVASFPTSIPSLPR